MRATTRCSVVMLMMHTGFWALQARAKAEVRQDAATSTTVCDVTSQLPISSAGKLAVGIHSISSWRSVKEEAAWQEGQKIVPLSPACLQEAVARVEAEDSKALTELLAGLVNSYLAGTLIEPNRVDIHFSDDSSHEGIAFPAFEVESSYLPGYHEVFLNRETFRRSVDYGIYAAQDLAQAKLITLFHEMVHVWQAINFPAANLARMEGHATFMQTVFAKDNGLQAINTTGIKAFTNANSIGQVLQQNWWRSYAIKLMINQRYYRMFNQMLAIYKKLDNLDAKARLQQASKEFLTYEGADPAG